jgi:hypothetical protein
MANDGGSRADQPHRRLDVFIGRRLTEGRWSPAYSSGASLRAARNTRGTETHRAQSCSS